MPTIDFPDTPMTGEVPVHRAVREGAPRAGSAPLQRGGERHLEVPERNPCGGSRSGRLPDDTRPRAGGAFRRGVALPIRVAPRVIVLLTNLSSLTARSVAGDF